MSRPSEMVGMLVECDLNHGAWERVDIMRSSGAEARELAGVDCLPSVDVYADESPATVRCPMVCAS